MGSIFYLSDEIFPKLFFGDAICTIGYYYVLKYVQNNFPCVSLFLDIPGEEVYAYSVGIMITRHIWSRVCITCIPSQL